ncbi:hypothetical protein DL96DRAFT_1714592 [Flagelloscypha sp. PMI_526]|nr:hypothetical protein DL96DRAFT_1714592 [Flagelloscypha sp. PMI_526]
MSEMLKVVKSLFWCLSWESLFSVVFRSLVTSFGFHTVTSTIIISGVLQGVPGGPATFQGAVLSYIVDVSSIQSLLSKLCLTLAIQTLFISLAPYFRYPMQYAYVALGVPLCLFIRYGLKESRQLPITLPSGSDSQIHFVQYSPFVWIKSLWGSLRSSRSLALLLLTTSLMCILEPFSLNLVLHYSCVGSLAWFKRLLKYPSMSSVLILLFSSLGVRHLPARIDRVKLSKHFGLASIASIIITHVGSHVGCIVSIPAVVIVFIFLSSLSAPLFPILTVVFCHMRSSNTKNRGSAMGAFALLQSVFMTIGMLVVFLPRTKVLSTVISAGISVIAFLALVFVRAPPLEVQGIVGEE